MIIPQYQLAIPKVHYSESPLSRYALVQCYSARVCVKLGLVIWLRLGLGSALRLGLGLVEIVDLQNSGPSE